MGIEMTATRWVYVMVQDPGKNERIVGRHDPERNIAFVPTFLTKEAAQQAALFLARERLEKYEIQAIIYEDLARYALGGGFLIFVLDGSGKILDQIAPALQTTG
jgi:hypothetical protein